MYIVEAEVRLLRKTENGYLQCSDEQYNRLTT